MPLAAEIKIFSVKRTLDNEGIPQDNKLLCSEFEEIFYESPGTIVGHKTEIRLHERIVLKILKSRPIPLPMQ